MKTFDITYDFTTLATVEISGLRDEVIKEMVDFWADAPSWLAENKGDYTKTWLKLLGRFILDRRRLPQKDDEGWYPLDGSFGIKVVSWEEWEHNFDDIDIEEKKEPGHG